MSIQTELRNYLSETGISQRSLSLRAGLNAKAVSDILNRPGLRPRYSTLSRLSSATGLDLIAMAAFPMRTYYDQLQELEEAKLLAADPKPIAAQITKIKWLIRKTGWVAQTRTVCRADVVDFFARSTAAELGLTKGSMSTYKSALLSAFDENEVKARSRNVTDVGGAWGDLKSQIKDSNIPHDLKNASGTFLVFLADSGIMPHEVSQATLLDYFCHRRALGKTTEVACQKHVKTIARLFTRLATTTGLEHFGLRTVEHPFDDGRNKFGVPDDAIAGLLAEWDRDVAPWAMGLASRDGMTRDAFIEMLDEQICKTDGADRKRTARRGRGRKNKSERTAGSTRRDENLRRHGFLTGKDRWSEKTAKVRRGYILALAKAHLAVTGECIETIAQLTDPEVLEDATDALADANDDAEFESGYIASILKTVRKVAAGFVRRKEDDITDIDDLITEFACAQRGIAPRNKARLRQFTQERIQQMIDLTDRILEEINRDVESKRKEHRRQHRKLPERSAVYDRGLVCNVMEALAHAIMMKRGPRSANLIGIHLDWIRWQGDLATIVIPAVAVKMRDAGDADLPIPLGASVSRLLRIYVEQLRQKALLPGDEKNPFLFPSQNRRTFVPGKPYQGILRRLVNRVHADVGVRMNPHLYRHLIGWIWLKESLDNLPKVQRLLGHKSLQTTIDHYAEIDETLALEEWQAVLDKLAA